ncbi:MAG: cytidylate kinase-like family protein [Chloroflexi bacterium]|nr:cytidylate kinase-like family protein [Chloroflexota bacterium]
MPVIAIEGRAGSLAPNLAHLIADQLEIDCIDRLLLAEIARKVGSTVQALSETERRPISVVDRLAGLVQRMLERSSIAGTGGDPYFGPGIDNLLSQSYKDLDSVITSPSDIDQDHFIESTREVIRDIAEDGSVVIVSRGGPAILRDIRSVLRVGVVADRDVRVQRIMARENLTQEDADDFVTHADHAQHVYFEKAFDTTPIDPFLYHVMINTSEISIERAADFLVPLAKELHTAGQLRSTS